MAIGSLPTAALMFNQLNNRNMTDEEFNAERQRRNIEERRRTLANSIYTLESFVKYYLDNESGHFFDKDTMHFWATRLCYGQGIKKTPNGLFFMHSDKRCFDDCRRVYVIRWWSVETSRFYNVHRSMKRSEIDRVWRNLTTDTDFDTTKEFDTAKFDEENPARW